MLYSSSLQTDIEEMGTNEKKENYTAEDNMHSGHVHRF